MRYVRLRTTVAKVVDEIIDEESTVRSILNVLLDKELDCTIRLTEGPKLEPARIQSLGDDSFTFRVVHKHNTLRKTVSYSEIDYLEVNTEDAVICRSKPNVSRWLLLDPAAEFP